MSADTIEPSVKGSMLATRPLWVRFNRGEHGLRQLQQRVGRRSRTLGCFGRELGL